MERNPRNLGMRLARVMGARWALIRQRRARGSLSGILGGLLAAGLALAAPNVLADQLPTVQTIAAYPGALERPIEQKISRGTEALLDWQHQINLKYDLDIRPRRARADHPLGELDFLPSVVEGQTDDAHGNQKDAERNDHF